MTAPPVCHGDWRPWDGCNPTHVDPGVMWVVLAIILTIVIMQWVFPPGPPEDRDEDDLDNL